MADYNKTLPWSREWLSSLLPRADVYLHSFFSLLSAQIFCPNYFIHSSLRFIVVISLLANCQPEARICRGDVYVVHLSTIQFIPKFRHVQGVFNHGKVKDPNRKQTERHRDSQRHTGSRNSGGISWNHTSRKHSIRNAEAGDRKDRPSEHRLSEQCSSHEPGRRNPPPRLRTCPAARF